MCVKIINNMFHKLILLIYGGENDGKKKDIYTNALNHDNINIIFG